MKSKNNAPKVVEDVRIEDSQMSEVMANCFTRYAKAVLLDRAIPDVRDGLKPVQRRIIYTMYEGGNVYSKPTRKCARTVGDVMGKYHPHGDSSIYEALVRLSQDWKMEVPLVTFQGNNGSIDNDPPAAYRYTESKLAKISELLVQDIEKNTVNMTLNFDDTLLEPTVLPARFPNLLVNGAQGIGVGTSTNIPTHNLAEVIDATIYRLEHRRCTVQDLLQFIKGPDFPTGGVIDEPEALKQLYETGQASFYIHCNTEIDYVKNEIIILGLPYGVVKSQFVADLDKRRINDNLDNIEEIIDESTDDIRIVIKVKPGQDPSSILNYLRSKGSLRTTFAANMLAIDKGHPKTMNVLDIINSYIAHQEEVITRRSKFDLDKKISRKEVVEGLIKAVSIISEIIETIRASKGKEDSKVNLINKFGFTTNQAEAIVTMQLYRLSNTDVTLLKEENEQIDRDIKELNEILSSNEKLDRLIVKDLKAIRNEYAKDRKTIILEEKLKTESVDVTKLIAKEDTMVVLTRDGYIKRTNLRSYQASINSDEANYLPKCKPGDGVLLNRLATTHDGILGFLESGTYFYIPVYALTDVKWKEEGKHLNTYLNIANKDKIVKAFVVSTFELDTTLALLTSEGKIKRTLLKEYEQSKLTPKPLKAISLSGEDKLVDVALTSGNSDLLVVQDNGYASRFNENEVPVVGIKAAGVKAINQGKENSKLIALLSLSSSEHVRLLLVSDKLCARLVSSTSIVTTSRLGLKQNLVRIFKASPMKLVAVSKVFKKKDMKNNIYLYSDETNEIVDISSLEVVTLGSGMKPNLTLSCSKVKGQHFEGEVIDSNCSIEKPTIVVEQSKAKEDNGDRQLSLFDLFDEDR